jgi:hypothetical protein
MVMSRLSRIWMYASLPLVLALVIALTISTSTPTNAQANQRSFAVKFVCGFQPPITGATGGEPPVKPGNYATEINIHNYMFQQVAITKRVLTLVHLGQPVGREPLVRIPLVTDGVLLPSEGATMDDCNRIWALLFGGAPPNPMPLLIGYLTVLSPVDLDVDAVYTALAPGNAGALGQGISEQVVRVPGKVVTVPAAAADAEAAP